MFCVLLFTVYYEGHDQFITNGGPPPLYPDQYGATYYPLQQQQQQQWPVPPAEARPIVDKTAEYVAKNSDDFERTVLEKHIDDPRFSFLNPWDQYHAYYAAMKKYFKSKADEECKSLLGAIPMPPEDTVKVNVQKLSSNGAVSFKLQPKTGATSADLPGPCSEFNKELGEGEELAEGVDEQECPPAKKQRVEAEEDDIGSTVQVCRIMELIVS